MADSKKNRAIAAELIARACRDGGFRQQFLADPKAVLIAAGVEIGTDVDIRALESTEKLRYIVLPPLTADASELTGAQLAAIAGGGASTGTSAESDVVSVVSANGSAEAQAMTTQTAFGTGVVTLTVTVMV